MKFNHTVLWMIMVILIIVFIYFIIYRKQQPFHQKVKEKEYSFSNIDVDNVKNLFQEKIKILPSVTFNQLDKQFTTQHYKDFLIIYSNQFNFQIKIKNKEIVYTNFINNNFDSYTGEGLLYKVSYDKDFNPNYEIYEGEFLNGLKHGKGKLFGQKSEEIIYDGIWQNDEKFPAQLQINLNDIQTEKINENIRQKIIIKEGDEIVNQKLNRRKSRIVRNSWIKLNQQISQNDIDVLMSHNQWFTSSIIDSLVFYINIKMDEIYFQMDKEKRRTIKRQIFIPSALVTQMHINQAEKNKQIFQKHFLEYKKIKYQIDQIYQKINIVINKNNQHWYLLQLNLNNNEMIVFDSIKSKIQSYSQQKDILNEIFENQIQKITISNQCKIQSNTYDCGPYACLNMLQIAQLQKELKEPHQIRQFLLNILQQQ